MAIVRTKPFLLISVLNKQQEILNTIQKLGCLQIEKIENSNETKNSNINKELNEIEKTKKVIEKAIEILRKKLNSKQQKNEEKKETKKFTAIDITIENKENIKNQAIKIIEKFKEIKILKSEIEKIRNQKKILENYKNLDCSIKNFETKNTIVLYGEIVGEFTQQEIENIFEKIKNLTYFEIIEKTKTKTTVAIIVCKTMLEQTTKILSKLSFSETKIETKNKPKEEILNLDEQVENIEKEILNLEKTIEKYIYTINDMKILVDFLNIEKDKLKAIKKFKKTKNTFIVKGFLNPIFEEKIKKIVKNKYNSYIEIFKETENCPVFFKNNTFVSPVETITKTYSMPSFEDIDPNPAMAFFYYIFFGMMFSDAGYGLILTIGCSIFLAFKKIQTEKKGFFKMFFFCGLSTIFWGLMYGSFFGDAILTISRKFLKQNISFNALWINATEKPLLLLILSISIGIFQIVVGILIKVYSLIKRKEIKEAIFCNLNWATTLVGIGFFLVNSILKVYILNYVGFSLFSIGIIITLFFSGYKEKKIMKILKGIINLYGITSYISDILSYSRLMALGIATGVIANVVNILASMGGNGTLGIILFIVILFVGHTLNFSINILGAYVHTNRLQYVEFFSKFYTGGGKSFSPFAIKTKYFNFSEISRK